MGKKSLRGFTVIELLVVVSIVGLISAIAIPSFKRFMLESRRAEGVQMLLKAYKDQQVYKQTHDGRTYTQYFEDENGVKLPTQYASRSRYNLIVGAGTHEVCTPPRKCALSQIVPLTVDIPGAPINRGFGYPRAKFTSASAAGGGTSPSPSASVASTSAQDPTRIMMGVEGLLDGQEFLDVLMIDENGSLVQICDGISKKVDENGKNLYRTNSYGGLEPQCTVTADSGNTPLANGGTGGGGGGGGGLPPPVCNEPPCD